MLIADSLIRVLLSIFLFAVSAANLSPFPSHHCCSLASNTGQKKPANRFKGSSRGGSLSAPAPTKRTIHADWAKSQITELQLTELVTEGTLPPKDQISWRVPGEETRPEPQQGEVIMFADHISWGFRPPGS